MKGLKKCSGLLFLLFTMLGLSLSVFSNDTSALKYAYDAFPLYRNLFTNRPPTSGTYFYPSVGGRFSVSFDSSSGSHSLYPKFSSDSVYTLCYNDSNRLLFDTQSISNRQQWNVYAGQDFRKSVINPNSYCGDSFTNSYASSWSFDSLYSSSYNLSNGDAIELVSLPESLFPTTEPLRDSGSLKSLTIPLGLDSQFNHIPANTPLSWDFGLVQKSANNFPYLSDDFIAQLYLEYFTSDPDSDSSNLSSYVSTWDTQNYISCSIDRNYRFTTRSNELWEDYLGFNVHCDFTPSTDIYYLNPSIYIAGNSTGNPPIFLTYDHNGLYFTGTYFITDNDDTWSGEYANSRPSGDSLSDSPGYHQLYGYDNFSGCVSGDWLCDLSNLFNFNFVNPFAPIFQMFSDNNSCASIPNVAGMLHSTETEVCPWFDSSIRNIVTPVLGLSSMMLVFGFAVRWLGSRSGNFIEDSGGVDSGGYHFENKFRRKK